MLINNMTNAEYHAYDALSSSGLKQLLVSPAHFAAWLSRPHEATAAMSLGTAVHSVLDPAQKVVGMPKCDRRTKAGKEEAESFLSRLGSDVCVLDYNDYLTYMDIRNALVNNQIFGDLLFNGTCEDVYINEIDGYKYKIKPDMISDNCMWDLKTTSGLSLMNTFIWDIKKYSYMTQLAYYSYMLVELEGMPLDSFGIIAIETLRPHGIKIYKSPMVMLKDKYWAQVEKGIKAYADFKKNYTFGIMLGDVYPSNVEQFPESLFL